MTDELSPQFQNSIVPIPNRPGLTMVMNTTTGRWQCSICGVVGCTHERNDPAPFPQMQLQLTLGQLINTLIWIMTRISPPALPPLPRSTPIRYDFQKPTGGWSHPGRPSSYRGYYEQLAFCDCGECGVGSSINIGHMLHLAEGVLGRTFPGYRGGGYTMHRGTRLWAAEYGAAGRPIMGVQEIGNLIILRTEDKEEW